jgi:hypothetical protein
MHTVLTDLCWETITNRHLQQKCVLTVRLSLNFILGVKIYTLDREDEVS